MIVNDKAMQEEIMLLASSWEGKFAIDGHGTDQSLGVTYTFRRIDFDTGLTVYEPARMCLTKNKVCIIIFRKDLVYLLN
jgi:hypothetical protein